MVCAEIVPNMRFNNLKIGGPCDGIYFSANKKKPLQTHSIVKSSRDVLSQPEKEEILRGFLEALSCRYPTWPVGRPIRNSCKSLFIILEILKFLNYSYFVQIMTRKLKIGNLTNMTELYP